MEDIYEDKDYIELRNKLRLLIPPLSEALIKVVGKAVQFGIQVLIDSRKGGV